MDCFHNPFLPIDGDSSLILSYLILFVCLFFNFRRLGEVSVGVGGTEEGKYN